MTLQKIQRQSAFLTQIAVIFFSESGRSQNIPAVCKTDFAADFSSLLICRLKILSLKTAILHVMENRGEAILYQPDNEVKLEVRLENETVWLTQAQLVELFQSSKANISEHIKNIYEQEELEASSTVRDFRTVRQEGGRQVARIITYYNLDAIISIGFRVNTKRGIQFRQWANKVLKEYLLKGYSLTLSFDSAQKKMRYLK